VPRSTLLCVGRPASLVPPSTSPRPAPFGGLGGGVCCPTAAGFRPGSRATSGGWGSNHGHSRASSIHVCIQHDHCRPMRYGSFALKIWQPWTDAHVRRFPNRETLSAEQLWREYFPDLPQDRTLQCFATFEREFHLPVGFLRPDDSLTALFAPVLTWNPIRWLFFRSLENDGVTEIRYQLELQLKRHGTDRLWSEIRTFGDFVRSWCGDKPRRSS
jgi:hypothetical protein